MARFLGPQEYGNFPYPPGFLYGLESTPSGADLTNDIAFTKGKCRDCEDTENIVLPSSLIKQMDAVWAPGTNAGMRDKLVAENSQSYHLHAIYNPTTGASDIIASVSHDSSAEVGISAANPAVVGWLNHGLVTGGTVVLRTTGTLPAPLVAGQIYYVSGATASSFNLSATNGGPTISTLGSSQSGVHTARGTPLLPSGYTAYRRFWTINRPPSNINRLFTQYNDTCYWQSPGFDVNTTAPGTVLRQDSFAASVPYGVRSLAIIRLYTGDNGTNIIFRGPGSNDSAISGTSPPLYDQGTNASLTGMRHFVPTNRSAIIEWKCSVASSLNGVRMATMGYVDYRGRIG